MVYFVYALVITLLILYFDKRFIKKDGIIAKIKYNFNLLDLVIYTILFVSFVMIIRILLFKVGLLDIDKGNFSIEMIPYILFSGIYIPLMEEYIFRYLPFKVVKKKYYLVTIILVNIIFALLHNTSLINSIGIFIMGVMFSVIYLKKGNILYSVCMHSFYNLGIYIEYFSHYYGESIYVLLFLLSIVILVVRKSKLSMKM